MYASDRYFSTLGLRIVRGRPFAAGDEAPGREGAVVNERFAAEFFPNEDPIGRRIRLATRTIRALPQLLLPELLPAAVRASRARRPG